MIVASERRFFVVARFVVVCGLAVMDDRAEITVKTVFQ